MPIIDEIPDVQQFTDILSLITGSDSDGTGLSGALSVLGGLNGEGLSASIGGQLNGHGSAAISIDADAITANVQSQLQGVVGDLPQDPQQLLAPVMDVFNQLKALLEGDFLAQLNTIFEGFSQIQSATPSNSAGLLQSSIAGIDDILAEFGDGAFADLRAWSESVAALGAEVNAVIDVGPDGLIERLIDYLSETITALVADILPGETGPALDLSAQFSALIDLDPLAAIEPLIVDLTGQMNGVQAQFEGDDFSTTAALQAAESSIEDLVNAITAIIEPIEEILANEFASTAGLAASLGQQYDDLKDAEIVDLADVRQTIVDAIGSVQEKVAELGLDEIQNSIEGVFQNIDETLSLAQLDQLESFFQQFQQQLESLTGLIDGQLLSAVASIRNVFSAIKSNIENLLSNIGFFDGDDQFHFNFEADLISAIDNIETLIIDTIQPMLETFQTTIVDGLNQFGTILSGVTAQIESVKNDLVALLQGVNDALDSADVPAAMESMAAALDEKIAQLGEISFEPVVDTVVEELNGMADQLRQIDVAAMSEITVGALKVSLEIVTNFDFASEIGGNLAAYLKEEVLDGIHSVMSEVEKVIVYIQEQFAKLHPDILLKELDELIEPIQAQLDGLELDKLLQPLLDWYESFQGQLDQLSIASLLQPIDDLFGQLEQSIDAVSPGQLIAPLEDAMAEILAALDSISLQSIRNQFNSAIQSVTDLLDQVSPENMLQPVLAPFETLEATLNGFQPSTLLEPVTDLFDSILEPLSQLQTSHVELISEAITPLLNLNSALSVEANFTLMNELFAQISQLLDQLNYGAILSEINGLYGGVNASFDSDLASVEVSASVAVLNPLQNSQLTELSTRIQGIREKLQSEFTSPAAPQELVAAYSEIEDKINRLAPDWLNGVLSAEILNTAIQTANPLNVGAEVDALYQEILDQVLSLSPSNLIVPLENTYDGLVAKVGSLSIDPLIDGVEGALNQLADSLEVVDPSILSSELDELYGEITSILGGLNPAAMAEELQASVDNILGLVDTINPVDIINGVDGPLGAAKDLAAEFDIDVFKAPINEVFDNINEIISQIDVEVLLSPITDRLEALLEEFETGVKRAETAFNEMLAAVPV